MSGELQRRIGSKVENMGGNAVVGYQQSFDIEGDSGIVVRGIGTAVTVELSGRKDQSDPMPFTPKEYPDSSVMDSTALQLSKTPPSDEQSAEMKQDVIPPSKIDNQSLEYPFYTLLSYPSGFISRLSFI
uniref:C2 domain-containing protein n=1 Tax=Ciona savignyi TaxID=51511 RepID=H2YYF3_CIOSA